MLSRPFAAYAARNAAPILEVLRREFSACREVLEIGSGTGQHAIGFAAELAHLRWQTSDLASNHAGIRAWLDEAGLDNVLHPLALDVRHDDIPADAYDAVFSANTAHIMSLAAVTAMFGLVGKTLRPRGRFCLYGPFRRHGAFNTQSNADFDTDLRRRDASMGIRDLEALDAFGADHGLARSRVYAMPSNNLLVSWCKEERT